MKRHNFRCVLDRFLVLHAIVFRLIAAPDLREVGRVHAENNREGVSAIGLKTLWKRKGAEKWEG